MKVFAALALLSSAVAPALAHYRWTSLIANGVTSAPYQYVRPYTAYNSPVSDLSKVDLRCNTGGSTSVADTATVAAGSTIGFALDQPITHSGVINVYLAKAPGTAASFDGSGAVWFRIAELSAKTDGGKTITFPATNIPQFTFKIPGSLPAGEYIVRIEHIALHVASTFGGAQLYISCANIKVTGGGSGNPGPKVSLPGYYTGNEPGILINIYYPIPVTYVQPGPALWVG